MFINLSSKNEPDPSKFKNDFSDSVVIPKGAYICLTKCSLLRQKERKQVQVPPDTELYFRYNAYDIVRMTLNAGGTANQVLTIPQLVTEIQNLWPATGYAYNLAINAVFFDPVGDGDDGQIFIEFTATQIEETQTDFPLKLQLYQQEWWYNRWGQCRDGAGALVTFPPNNGGSGATINYVYSPAAQWAMGSVWDQNTYTVPPNQPNGLAFNTLVTPFIQRGRVNGYDPVQFFIYQQNTDFLLGFGSSTVNGAGDYLTGAYRQSATWDSNGTNGKPNVLTCAFEIQAGEYSSAVYDADDQTFAGRAQNRYQPGDYFEFYPLPSTQPNPDPDRCFYMNVQQWASNSLMYGYNGNLGAIGDRPGGNNFFLSNNVGQPLTNVMSNMCFIYDNEHIKNEYYSKDVGNIGQFLQQWEDDFGFFRPNGDASWQTNAIIGSATHLGFKVGGNQFAMGSGWIYNQTGGRPATKQFLLAFEDGVSNQAQWRYAPAVQGFNNTDGVQRADGSAIEIPNVFRLRTDDIPMSAPTLVCASMQFNLLAEAMIPNALDANLRTVLGGVAGITMQFQLNQANNPLPAGFDVRVGAGGAFVSALLTDGGGARINFRSSNNATGYTYNWSLAYFGTNINECLVSVQEIVKPANTTNVYTAIIPLGAGNTMQPFNCVGGIDPLNDAGLTNYNNYCPLTYISNVRVFQNNLHATNSNLMWNTHITAMQGATAIIPDYAVDNQWFSINGGQEPPNIDFYPNATATVTCPTPAMGTGANFDNVGLPDPAQNLGVFLSKPDGGGVTDGDQPIINSLYVPSMTTIENVRRRTDLSAFAYSGEGMGMVDVSQPATRSAEDVFDFINPIVAGDQVIEPPAFVAPNTNNPALRIITDFDDAELDAEAINVEITNLPHRTMNGANKSYDKTIYQLPVISNTAEVGTNEVVEHVPPTKVWIPLDNAMEIPITRLDVQLSDVEGKQLTQLRQETNLSIEIQDNINLLN